MPKHCAYRTLIKKNVNVKSCFKIMRQIIDYFNRFADACCVVKKIKSNIRYKRCFKKGGSCFPKHFAYRILIKKDVNVKSCVKIMRQIIDYFNRFADGTVNL